MFLRDLFEHGSGVEKLKGSWQSHMHEEDLPSDFTDQEMEVIHRMDELGYDRYAIAHAIGNCTAADIAELLGHSLKSSYDDEWDDDLSESPEDEDELEDLWNDPDWEERFDRNAGIPSNSFSSMVKRVGQKAKSGEQRTYYNPETGKYSVGPKKSMNLEGFPNAQTMTAVNQATKDGAGVAAHAAMDSDFAKAMSAKGPVGAVGTVKERRRW